MLRTELQAALSANTNRLCAALQRELLQPIELREGQPLRFEVDPVFFAVTSCATHNEILPGEWLDRALAPGWFDRCEVMLGGWSDMVVEELGPWFAECWQSVGGPALFSPAYLYFHGARHRQFDLEQTR